MSVINRVPLSAGVFKILRKRTRLLNLYINNDSAAFLNPLIYMQIRSPEEDKAVSDTSKTTL